VSTTIDTVIFNTDEAIPSAPLAAQGRFTRAAFDALRSAAEEYGISVSVVFAVDDGSAD
jgi:hypothetical protein